MMCSLFTCAFSSMTPHTLLRIHEPYNLSSSIDEVLSPIGALILTKSPFWHIVWRNRLAMGLINPPACYLCIMILKSYQITSLFCLISDWSRTMYDPYWNSHGANPLVRFELSMAGCNRERETWERVDIFYFTTSSSSKICLLYNTLQAIHNLVPINSLTKYCLLSLITEKYLRFSPPESRIQLT